MRLIDADALLEKLRKTDRYFMVKFDIESEPTVELTAAFMRQQSEDELIRIRAEADQRGYERGYRFGFELGQKLKRPTGKWKEYSGSDAKGCSLCGYLNYSYSEYKYCPNCGAKMEVKK